MRSIGLGVLGLIVALAGCGDDDGGMDAGGRDAGRDTGTDSARPDAARPDTGSAGDAGSDAGTGDAGTTGECDPFADPSGCEEGSKCSVVLDVDPDGNVVDVFFGCVDASRSGAEGVPCGFSVDATPDDDTDDRLADTCAEGLFCTSFGNDPGDSVRRCRRICDGETTDCGDRGYCLGLNGDPFFGGCITSDGCDPVAQDCTDDRACYLFATTGGDLVGDCWEWMPMEGSDGMPGNACEFFDQCAPGASCRPISDTARACLSFCEAAAPVDGGVDAGADAGAASDAGAGADAGADAGASSGCTAPDECLLLEPAEGGMSLTPVPVGVCAPPGG